MKKIWFLLSTFFFVNTSDCFAQNQTLLATGYASKNLFRDISVTPAKRLIARANGSKLGLEDQYLCPWKKPASQEDQTLDFLDEVSQMCKAWSEDQRCDCELRCPDDYTIIFSPF